MLGKFDNMLGEDRVDEAVEIFTETLLKAADKMKVCKRNSRGDVKNSMSINTLKQPVRWDIECEDKKRIKNSIDILKTMTIYKNTNLLKTILRDAVEIKRREDKN